MIARPGSAGARSTPKEGTALAETLRMHVTVSGEVRIYRMPLTDKHLDHLIPAMAARQPQPRIELVVPANVPREKSAALAKRLAAAGIREIAISAP